jgi:hypothetical protein
VKFNLSFAIWVAPAVALIALVYFGFHVYPLIEKWLP